LPLSPLNPWCCPVGVPLSFLNAPLRDVMFTIELHDQRPVRIAYTASLPYPFLRQEVRSDLFFAAGRRCQTGGTLSPYEISSRPFLSSDSNAFPLSSFPPRLVQSYRTHFPFLGIPNPSVISLPPCKPLPRVILNVRLKGTESHPSQKLFVCRQLSKTTFSRVFPNPLPPVHPSQSPHPFQVCRPLFLGYKKRDSSPFAVTVRSGTDRFRFHALFNSFFLSSLSPLSFLKYSI